MPAKRRCPKCGAEVAGAGLGGLCLKCVAQLALASTEVLKPIIAAPGQHTEESTVKPRGYAARSRTDSADQGLTAGTLWAERYRIVDLLGEGGMGKVYRADDLKLGQPVALKFLPPALASDPSGLMRFRKEVRIAREVSHPNVCRVYDIGEAEGEHFISMEYVDGEDLKSLLRRIGRLPQDKAIEIARQLCAGLAAAHDKGILHRDLKPANIMIDGRGKVRITDFGIAGVVGEIKAEEVRAGTPTYMAPEQLAGTEVTVRSDIYSLGLLLYEIFTGKRAIDADSLTQIQRAHERGTPRTPSSHIQDLDPKVERIILQCLETESKNRPRSAIAVAAALPGADLLTGAISPGDEGALGRRGKNPRSEKQKSIAVLPFVNMSSDRENEYLSDGITEDLIMALSQVKGLRVPARTSSFMFKGKNEDIRRIGQQLSVETLLEGSVRKVGNRLRITAQLIDVADGDHLWSERYDREMEDVFAIQDEITRAIVEALKVQLIGAADKPLARRHTENIEAYQFYLKGRYCWEKWTAEGWKQGIEFFQQAIERDPTYALAYSGLSDSYFTLGWYGVLPPKEAFSKAKAAATKALEMDDSLAEAHNSMAAAFGYCAWDWAAAEREVQRAIELNPNYATAHHWYAEFFMTRGRHNEALTEIKRALEIDPLSLIINSSLGWQYHFARQYDQAIEQYQKTIELDSNFATAHWCLGWAYEQKRMFEKAIAESQKAVDLFNGSSRHIAWLGHTYAVSGKRDESQNILEQLKELSRQSYVSPCLIAIVHMGLGEIELALEWLDKAYEDGSSWLVYLKVDPRFDSLRSDPRFKALLKKIGLEN